MAEQIPPWLAAMRAITGLTETPGSADNPKIMFMADYIGKKYPEQKAYSDLYTGDDVAWCGLTVGFCMAAADIKPVFGPTDTDRWMWAQAWAGKYWEAEKITEPCLGAVIVMSREGGGHVTLMEAHEDGSFLKDGYYRGRGGNQSDMVNVSNQAKSSVIALMWPKAGGRPSRPTLKRPELSEGDVGKDVESVQKSLLIPADGERRRSTPRLMAMPRCRQSRGEIAASRRMDITTAWPKHLRWQWCDIRLAMPAPRSWAPRPDQMPTRMPSLGMRQSLPSTK
jgi:uncharacterized protein (TIGR02594 family)